ncbi:MAG: hypothetical protein QM778_04705 [Myxococcales bacterium]
MSSARRIQLWPLVVFCGIAVVTLAWLPHARAQEAPPGAPSRSAWARALAVEPGASCLVHAQLVDHVATWLGARSPGAELHVVVRGDAERPQRVSVLMQRGERSYRRDFESTPERCADRHAVIGLAVAMAIDAELATGLGDAPEHRVSPVRRNLELQVGLGYGVLPTLSVGPQVGTVFGLSSWLSVRMDALAQFWPRNSLTDSHGTFDAMLFAGSLQLLAGGSAGTKAHLSLGGGLAVGAVHARGRGYAPSRTATAPWLALRVGLRAELRSALPWVLEVSAIAPVISHAFEAGAGAERRREAESPLGVLVHTGPSFSF